MYSKTLPRASCNDRSKILIEDHGEDGGGKCRVGKVIHRPAKNFSFFEQAYKGGNVVG